MRSDPPTYLDERIDPADWPAAVSDTDGAQLIVAGPGAGKSEFLVRRVGHILSRHDLPASALLVLTFSRRSAADLRRRIAERTPDTAGGLGVSTFHSFAFRFLELHAHRSLGWSSMPAILTGPEQVGLVAELLADSPEANWPISFREMLGTRTLAAEVTDFILRARERLIGPAELADMAEERADWRALPEFLVRYDRALRSHNRIDYGTLQAVAVSLFDDPEVHQSAADQFRYVMADEYQDTTVAQARLLRGVSAEHGNITVAADPYQSIYSFRGTELSNVAEFPDRFRNVDGSPARRRTLATSFRVPAEILRAAERVTTSGALPGAAGPVEPAPHAGRVDVHVFDQQSEEADWIASEVNRLHIETGMSYRNIAVVVRTKRRLLNELSRALERRGVPHNQPDARLADHPAVQMIFDIARAASTSDDAAATPAIRRVLLGPLFSLGIGAQRQLERDRSIQGCSWSEVIRGTIQDGHVLARLVGDADWVDQPAVDAFWHIWTTLPQFDALVHNAAMGEYRAAWASLAQALSRLDDRAPGTTMAHFVSLTESDDFEASPLLSYRDPNEDRLALTTLHQAKGLEFDVVFIADAVEGALPDLRQRQSLLQTGRLNPDLAADPASTARRRMQEEMRLVYTAMTRARTRVVWTATTAGIDEGHQRPSRFLAAVAADEIPITQPQRRLDRPITPQEAEAWLRTILTDPAEGSARRLAATFALAAGNHPRMRSPETFAMVRTRGSDHGLVPDGAMLSPSQAEAFDTCPRRYALERRLRIGDPPSFYIAFGLLIHRVLELSEEVARAQQRRSTIDEALTHLETEFDRHDFGAGSWKSAWHRRAVTLLTQLYDGWPHPDAVPALLEHDLSLEVEGTIWRGIVDRIEQSPDGSLRIVDYKTGKTPPTKKEAEVSLQLGFYLLAASFDDKVGAIGRPSEAEYWHPLATAPTRRVTPFDVANVANVRDRLVDIAHGIRAEAWEPRPGSRCRTCSVKLVCPAWPEGQEAFVR